MTPDIRGVWLVSTLTSRHIWNLDDGTYTRLPGQESKQFPFDGGPHDMTRVERWPRVGDQSLVWFDDPYRPAFTEHYRASAPITSITRLVKLQTHG